MTIPGLVGLATTAGASECLERAQSLANDTSHRVLALEHLLVALIEAEEAAVIDSLKANGLERTAITTQLLKAGGRPPRGRGGRGKIEPGSVSPAARKAIGDASRAAQERGERVGLGDLANAVLHLKSNPLTRLGASSGSPRERAGGRTKGPTRPGAPARQRKPPRIPSEKSRPSSRSPSVSSNVVAAKQAMTPEGGFWRFPLLLAIPASMAISVLGGPESLIFLTAAVAIIPLAGFMGQATEQVANRSGPALGGFLNATFGNAAELIIAVVALRAGLVDLVKASITGSILGNLLLILGLSFIAGGIGRPVLTFSRTAAGMSAGMLALAVTGLVFPALFQATHSGADPQTALYLSEAVALILAVTYALSLVFSFRTHRRLFSTGHGQDAGTPGGWSMGKALGVLLIATVGVAVESEMLVHSVESVTESFGLSQAFLGLIVIPIIGNAAEHSTAVLVARKGKMDLALQIALGSSTQVALFVAPLLVLIGVLVGQEMTLVFTSFEVMALGLATIITSILTLDGEANWFEGVQLLAVFALVAVAAYFV